ncbi:10212_t:CDS:1, partial [Funneliformis caledonium]
IIVDESALIKPKFEVKQVKVTNTTDNGEIDYTTGYDVVDAKIPMSTVTKIIDMKPIAVLHLNYRSVDWLAKIGFPMPILNNNVVMEQPREIIEIDVDSTKRIMEINNNNVDPTKGVMNDNIKVDQTTEFMEILDPKKDFKIGKIGNINVDSTTEFMEILDPKKDFKIGKIGNTNVDSTTEFMEILDPTKDFKIGKIGNINVDSTTEFVEILTKGIMNDNIN